MTQLMLHRGARLVERPELEAVYAPPPTETWFPIRHGKVLETVESTLGAAGFSIARSQFAFSPDNGRFFGTLDLETPISSGVSLTVGVRNSIDKTFPIGMVAGNRVFCCDNLAFSGEIYVAKKHTRFGAHRFHEGIAAAVATLNQYREVEAKRITDYRHAPVDETQAAATLLHAFEEGILSTHTLPAAIEEWRHPAQDEFQPRDCWSLFNAFTSALKSKAESNPAAFAALTMRLYRLIDEQAKRTLVV